MVFNPAGAASDGYFVDVRDQLMWLILQVGWSKRKRVVIRKQLTQNYPHLEFLRAEALTGEPCSPARSMPKSSSSAKGINMITTGTPPRYPPAFCTLNMMTRLACSDCSPDRQNLGCS